MDPYNFPDKNSIEFNPNPTLTLNQVNSKWANLNFKLQRSRQIPQKVPLTTVKPPSYRPFLPEFRDVTVAKFNKDRIFIQINGEDIIYVEI
ncbi:6526_t:CDS:2 [Cetraspora pellucida]|uniref:6526_t:CDS:1 n=1 Tax=Cetraspora pellucida TaxID=1433469 RepID=A0A9N9BU13_9GLOM|nr:6526_t:CDS:2 [Cetraspora pellucida]